MPWGRRPKGTQRKTVIRLLKMVSEKPVPFKELLRHFCLNTTFRLNALLEAEFPHGLRGLVSIERWPSSYSPAVPMKIVVIQPAGLELLERLKSNPNARVSKKIYDWKPVVSVTATEFQKERNEKFFRRKKREMRKRIREAFAEQDREQGREQNRKTNIYFRGNMGVDGVDGVDASTADSPADSADSDTAS